VRPLCAKMFDASGRLLSTPKRAFRVAGSNAGTCPRLWENVWDEAADALCFPARQLGCRIDRLTRCGLDEAIRS